MYTPDRAVNPPSFYEAETEDEYIDCELCGDAFLVENIQHFRGCNHVCPNCIQAEIEIENDK